ncbi:hypothetical protein H8790_04160 [Oscillibacter hominis]|uniref:Uncharacterized protein n=1 Tax=Oscillibacter hominis TaxID=2763056 RepID=A0A7G9B6N9_9FIRM|nr:hypothetical protein [Oscillibacter hominis]QNL45220.1 hypothetical protein H8790_04160 [Oscillibacter hominis]
MAEEFIHTGFRARPAYGKPTPDTANPRKMRVLGEISSPSQLQFSTITPSAGEVFL